jgi:hypothetical protein
MNLGSRFVGKIIFSTEPVFWFLIGYNSQYIFVAANNAESYSNAQKLISQPIARYSQELIT